MNDFMDRLLDAGLKEYSRVTPPADFVTNLAVRRPRPRPRFAWAWLLVPAATAVAMVVMVRPAPLPPAPERFVATIKAPAVREGLVRLVHHRPHVRYRTLTAVEIARLEIPAELLAQREETPITDLVIKPLESANPTEKE